MIQLLTCESYHHEISFQYLDEKKAPFKGEYLSTFYFYEETGISRLVVGLGNTEAFEIKQIKEVVAKGVKALKALGTYNFSIDVYVLIKNYGLQAIYHLVEGAKLGLYELKHYKKDQEEKSYNIYLRGVDKIHEGKVSQLITQAEHLVDGVIFARDLVNAPANKLTPQKMAEAIKEQVKETNIEVKVLDEVKINDLGMEAFLTVGISSGNSPRLIVLRYMGCPEQSEITALVGKGVTCDTGGYCIKPGGSMLGIKGDMAGAAAVTGAIYALAKNEVKTNVVVVIPACENRISRESFIPGDVISSMSGKSIEIANTDAEGRLILADAVTYAIQEEKATRIVDIATLTGAVVAMFGFTTAGALSTSDDLYDNFKTAYEISGEQYWRLPIFPEYRKMIKSKIADVCNMSNDGCGTITAGLFIESFTQGLPWLHLDIAGSAWVDSPKFEYQSVGATGAGTTSLYFLLEAQSEK